MRPSSLISLLLGLLLLGVAAPGRAECVYPETFGALVDDNVDDLPAIRLALDFAAVIPGKHEVCLGVGAYDVYRPANQGGYGTVGLIQFKAMHSRTVMRGAGKWLTTIRMRGDFPSDVYGIEFRAGAEQILVTHLMVDSSLRTLGNEQLHLIGGGVEGTDQIDLHDLAGNNPPMAGSRIGDCFRFLAPSGYSARRFHVDRFSGVHCGRSFVGVNYGVHELRITNSSCGQVTDQCIDGEVSASIYDPATVDILISGNMLMTGGNAFAIAMSGQGKQAKLTIVGNHTDAGIHVFNAKGVVIAGNYVGGPIVALKEVDGLSITGNTVDNSRPEPAISATQHNGFAPSNVSVTGNTVIQRGESRPLNFSGVIGLAVTSNSVRYLPTTPRVALGLSGLGLIDGVAISGNSFVGDFSYLISAEAPVGKIMIFGNSSTSGQGAWFQGTLSRCVMAANMLEGATWASSGFVPASPSGCTGQYP